MAEFQLHCFAESGNSYKPALFLTLAGLDWEPIFVDYIAGGETRTERYREEINEMGEAPVLTHRGRRVSQSGAILTYLADVTGHFAPAPEDRYEALRWILFDNHKFTSYFATLRFMLNFAKTGETATTEFLRGRAKTAYAVVDKHLSTRAFVLGARPTIADLSLAGYMYSTPSPRVWIRRTPPPSRRGSNGCGNFPISPRLMTFCRDELCRKGPIDRQ